MLRRVLPIGAVAVLALSIGPATAPASVTFGDSLGVPEGIIIAHPACGKPCTLATTISPEHLVWFRAPLSGTIVRWRIQTVAGSEPQMLRLRVLEAAPGDELGPGLSEPFLASGTSEPVAAPLGAGTFAFPTRLPVKAGDFIGLDTEGALAAVAVEEESIRVFEPPPTDFGPAAPGLAENYALLINADVAAPPHTVLPSACEPGTSVSVGVIADPDPAVQAQALLLSVDGGATRRIAVAGSDASVQVALSPGVHTLESRAEDSLGQLEAQPQRATVLVGAVPTVSIASEQHLAVYPQGAHATVAVSAADTVDRLEKDPNAIDQAIATNRPGKFTIARTATDSCGNSSTATFAYTVQPAPRITALRMVAPGPHRGRAIAYRDTLRARATFTLERLGGRRPLTIAHLAHSDLPGANRLQLGRLHLAPGRYRLRARARVSGGGAGAQALLEFRVSR